MSKVAESTNIQCTLEELESFLDRFFAALPGSGADSVLRVRVPLHGDVAVEKDVVAHIVDLEHGVGAYKLAIEWKPAGDGPYPRFRGTLGATAEGAAGPCTLTMTGEYDPPGGVIGRVFDAPLGALIARVTLRELLARLKTNAERELVHRR